MCSLCCRGLDIPRAFDAVHANNSLSGLRQHLTHAGCIGDADPEAAYPSLPGGVLT